MKTIICEGALKKIRDSRREGKALSAASVTPGKGWMSPNRSGDKIADPGIWT
jgi:hypothetical protein